MTCPTCNGTGAVMRPPIVVDGLNYPACNEPCEECDGEGEICPVCYCSTESCLCDLEWETEA